MIKAKSTRIQKSPQNHFGIASPPRRVGASLQAGLYPKCRGQQSRSCTAVSCDWCARWDVGGRGAGKTRQLIMTVSCQPGSVEASVCPRIHNSRSLLSSIVADLGVSYLLEVVLCDCDKVVWFVCGCCGRGARDHQHC